MQVGKSRSLGLQSQASELPVGFYVQGAAGMGLASALAAVEAGADLVATAVYPLALTLHRVSGESLAESLEGLGRAAGLQTEARGDAAAHLDRGDAHLAVALDGVGVAHAEERPVHPHRQVERRARGELLDVHVAAVLPGRHGAVAAGHVERGPHHARERRNRHRDVVARAGVGAVAQVPDLQVRLAEI